MMLGLGPLQPLEGQVHAASIGVQLRHLVRVHVPEAGDQLVERRLRCVARAPPRLDARADRTASQGHEERVGVCRDFAHLAITLCRCMNIPARYCTGYLGDIGMPPPYGPMDFAAWFEVFLDGRWHTFDARNNTPRIGRVLIARGRDAAAGRAAARLHRLAAARA